MRALKILVTGANGFVGTAICNILEKNSFNLVKFLNKKTNQIKDTDIFKIHYLDITDINEINETKNKLIDIDVVIHTAGLAHQFGNAKKESFQTVNVEGTRNIAMLAKQINVKHFILISSVSVYGEIEEKKEAIPVEESSECRPIEPYAKSKLTAEKVCENLFHESQTRLSILRLATVIGEGDKGNVLRLIKAIDERKFIWIGKGKNLKSLIHKQDVASAVLKVVEKNRSKYEVLNISSEPETMYNIVSTISNSLAKPILPIKIPYKLTSNIVSSVNKIFKSVRLNQINKRLEKWVSNDYYSATKLNKVYGFKCEIEISDALEREVNWYLSLK